MTIISENEARMLKMASDEMALLAARARTRDDKYWRMYESLADELAALRVRLTGHITGSDYR